MRMYVLSKECNTELRCLLNLEYVREESLWFFQDLEPVMVTEAAMGRVSENIVEVVNTIIIDNLLRLISQDNISAIVNGVKNSTLGFMLETGYSHLSSLLDHFCPVIEEAGYDKYVIKAINKYINGIYMRNLEAFNSAVMRLVETLYLNLNPYRKNIIRSGFIYHDTPVVFVSTEVS